MQKIPRGIRNNNPGNIRISGDNWQGLSRPQLDQEFFQFTGPEWGVRALAKILLTYQNRYHRHTIRQIIARWAPPTENDTMAYIKAVARDTGFGEDQPLDLRRVEHITPLIRAIIRHENGQQPYMADVIAKGIGMAGIYAQRQTENR